MRFYKWILPTLIAGGMILAGCAGAPSKPSVTEAPAAPPGAPKQLRQVVIYIPQSDETAAAWLKLLDRNPRLHLVVAVSPRFHRFEKDANLKAQATALMKTGRLELALQLPNPPILPLLINTHSARLTMSQAALPNPPFAFPEDVSQVVARAKSEFFHVWGFPPKGLVLPHGAVDDETVKLLDHLALNWVAAGLNLPPGDAPYKFGGLALLDATPRNGMASFSVQVLDEREGATPAGALEKLNLVVRDLEKKGGVTVLPSENLAAVELPGHANVGGRSWTNKDWSPWIGTPEKNEAWDWLRKTRAALERYKNSGQASVHRLDMAFEEMYTAENSNYFSGIREQEHDFKATLSAVYRMMGQSPPDDLFNEPMLTNAPGPRASSTVITVESLPGGQDHLIFDDLADDDHGDGRLPYPGGVSAPGSYDLRRFEILASSDTLNMAITLGAPVNVNLANAQAPVPLIDIYMDLNGQSNVGTLNLLPGRGASAAPSDAWEYAVSVAANKAQIFRTQGGGNFELINTLPVNIQGNTLRLQIPRDWIHGNPMRWGYQVLIMAYDAKSTESDPRPLPPPTVENTVLLPIYDLLDPIDVPQGQLLREIEEGRRNDIPFLRAPPR